MDNTDCMPGHTLLRLHKSGLLVNDVVMNSTTDFRGSKYLSSEKFRNNNVEIGSYPHGPCSTKVINGREVDYASCFHCQSWPEQSDFRNRTKDCSWPSRQLVNKIVKNGCHVVAIGDKHSRLFAMQWRISFARAEKSLVWSFNHVQLKTYALLKIFLKECIESNPSTRELLCSYFMKTIVFHAIEHRPSMWVNDNIVKCFWYCFSILLECVQTGYLPNYFVLANNLFHSNVTGDNRNRLLNVLERYYDRGWTCLFDCLRSTVPQRIGHDKRNKLPGDVLREAYHDEYIWSHFHMYCNLVDIDIADALKLVQRVFLNTPDDSLCDTAVLYFIHVIRRSICRSYIADPTNGTSNKSAYRQIRRNKQLLHLSSSTDVSSGPLSLATFYYNVGCYTKASELATRVVSACRKGGLLQSHGDRDDVGYEEQMCGKGYTVLQKAKSSFVHEYIIDKTSNKLYPPELFEVVDRNANDISLPLLPYAIFLLVLSTFRLGDSDQSQTMLDDLIALRTDAIYGVRHYPILDSLVRICHELLGNTSQAIKSSEGSCRKLSDSPAALIKIADLRQTRNDEQTGKTDFNTLDYCNVKYHKTMYTADPDNFIKMSWF
ncbi:uncharacterized protein LOC117321150 [Pecten maximus]|uniref:uncharacterized protein LOC117321150 n=1 Tax=Pecten maximus TaxID=6579 RepID=UPI001458C46A|nr:uncharacterized protein LOC117321150 [Pecten maximus]